MLVRSTVLIPLDKIRFTFRNQKACHVIGIKILVDRPTFPVVEEANYWLAWGAAKRIGDLEAGMVREGKRLSK